VVLPQALLEPGLLAIAIDIACLTIIIFNIQVIEFIDLTSDSLISGAQVRALVRHQIESTIKRLLALQTPRYSRLGHAAVTGTRSSPALSGYT
jgi:hypothetical protein